MALLICVWQLVLQQSDLSGWLKTLMLHQRGGRLDLILLYCSQASFIIWNSKEIFPGCSSIWSFMRHMWSKAKAGYRLRWWEAFMLQHCNIQSIVQTRMQFPFVVSPCKQPPVQGDCLLSVRWQLLNKHFQVSRFYQAVAVNRMSTIFSVFCPVILSFSMTHFFWCWYLLSVSWKIPKSDPDFRQNVSKIL